MSTPFAGLEHFARVTMERLNADTETPTALDTIISTREGGRHGSPPRIVWVPSRDRFGGAQKTPRGANGRSLITRFAGAQVMVWGAESTNVTSIAATEALVRRLCRALLKTGGPEPYFQLVGGQWEETPGEMALGEAYVLSVAVAIDVPDLTRSTVTIDAVALDPSRSTAGDGLVDAGEPAPTPTP